MMMSTIIIQYSFYDIVALISMEFLESVEDSYSCTNIELVRRPSTNNVV